MTTIIDVDVHDVRFPTAAAGDGSDAINRGDYSATYVELRTDAGADRAPGFTFTNGRGNEITCAADRGAGPPRRRAARSRRSSTEPVAFWRSLTADVQLRWLGPEKGVIHMATGALVNAVWDLRAKAGRQAAVAAARRDARRGAGRAASTSTTSPTRSPPTRRWRILDKGRAGYAERLAVLERDGFPSYTTSVGWLGYPDEQGARADPAGRTPRAGGR